MKLIGKIFSTVLAVAFCALGIGIIARVFGWGKDKNNED